MPFSKHSFPPGSRQEWAALWAVARDQSCKPSHGCPRPIPCQPCLLRASPPRGLRLHLIPSPASHRRQQSPLPPPRGPPRGSLEPAPPRHHPCPRPWPPRQSCSHPCSCPFRGGPRGREVAWAWLILAASFLLRFTEVRLLST